MKRLFYIVVTLVFSAFVGKEPLFEVPQNWPKPKYDFRKNPLTENKVLLGRTLFYDPLLSKDNIISCASCHSPFSAFTHIDHPLSHGIHDSIGTRNSPALMNLAWQNLFMWDGAVNNLDMQALATLSHPAELGSSIQELIQKLNASKLYKQLFLTAYGDSVATGETALKAISQFMLTLVSANSKYDRVKNGKESFNTQELNGYKLFQQSCATCHQEPLFTTNEFANHGLEVDSLLNDVGRIKVTLNTADSLKFKIPTLRNIEYSYPYMHDGRFKKLSQVLNHYTNGLHQSKTIAHELTNGSTPGNAPATNSHAVSSSPPLPEASRISSLS
jgi:cytochrome c peroxidase